MWAYPLGYIDSTNCPFGNSKEAIQPSWVKSFHDAGVKSKII